MLSDYTKLLFLNTAVLVPEKKIIIRFDSCTEESRKELAWWQYGGGLAPRTGQRAGCRENSQICVSVGHSFSTLQLPSEHYAP